MSPSIYLDHAAATPLDERVFAVMEPYLKDQFYNPSSAYDAGRQVRQALEAARHQLAMTIGGKRDEVIFTAGATESVNIAFTVAGAGGHVVIGATEHAAVRAAAATYDYSVIPADHRGLLELSALEGLIREDTVLVSIAYADSELGTVQSLNDAARIIAAVRANRAAAGNKTPLYLHTDASQAALLCDLNVARLGVDMMTISAAKCYGPKQVALLWARGGIRLEPIVRGGGQEHGLRSGTENVAGAIGFAEALFRAQKHRHAEAERLSGLRRLLLEKLEASVPELQVNGHPKRQLPSHVHIAVPGLDAERAVFGLDAAGVMVATGAACAANKNTRSSVLVACGMSDETADGSLRLSLGHLNDESQMVRAAELIAEVIERERRL